MVSLTDLWKAVGAENRNRPKDWLKTKGAQDLIKVLAKGEDSTLYVQIRKGTGGGTFAHWQIALAYAKWLSPELHMAANAVFRGYVNADPAMAASIIQRAEDK